MDEARRLAVRGWTEEHLDKELHQLPRIDCGSRGPSRTCTFNVASKLAVGCALVGACAPTEVHIVDVHTAVEDEGSLANRKTVVGTNCSVLALIERSALYAFELGQGLERAELQDHAALRVLDGEPKAVTNLLPTCGDYPLESGSFCVAVPIDLVLRFA